MFEQCRQELAEDAVDLVVPNGAEAHSQSIDSFFSAAEARSDRWRELNAAASAWVSMKHDGAAAHQRVVRLFHELAPLEAYWSYPGPTLMQSLKERLDAHDAGIFSP